MSPRLRGTVVVLAKAPRAGGVKMRMCPPLSPAQAAELYRELLGDVLTATAEFSEALDLEPVVAVHPGAACAEIAREAPAGFRVVAQRGADLGQRMTWAARQAAAWGARAILLRGSDSPALDGEAVARALGALDEVDVVLCADTDGGYSLVGLRAPAPGLFDHPMGTRSVLEDTLANAAALGLRTYVAKGSFDLDTVADLQQLAELRGGPHARLCARTLAHLDQHRLWRLVSAPDSDLTPP